MFTSSLYQKSLDKLKIAYLFTTSFSERWTDLCNIKKVNFSSWNLFRQANNFKYLLCFGRSIVYFWFLLLVLAFSTSIIKFIFNTIKFFLKTLKRIVVLLTFPLVKLLKKALLLVQILNKPVVGKANSTVDDKDTLIKVLRMQLGKEKAKNNKPIKAGKRT